MKRGADEPSLLVRAPFVRIWDRGDELNLLGDDGALRRLDGSSAELVRIVLDELRIPRTREQLLARIAEVAGEDAARSPVVDQALELLVTTGVVVPAPVGRTPALREGSRVVVGLSGGIVAAHAPVLAEILIQRGLTVRFAATPSALRFVSRLALEAMTHERVVDEPWPGDPREPVPHLELAKWADVIVVYPATATTLARIARGDCSTVVSALAIGARAPVVLVPAMNDAMLRAPSVQRNLAQLREDGFCITHPSLGWEVADEPGEREPAFGAAPPVHAVVDIVAAVLAAPGRASAV